MRTMYKNYNVLGREAENVWIQEDLETGELQLVVEASVVASASPKRVANYEHLASMKGELLNTVGAERSRIVVIPA